MPKRKERAALYVRESDPALADSTTIESAANAVREYCKKEGYILEKQHEYIEAISAYSVPYYERTELMKALKAAERHEFDVIVVTEVRALSRKGAAEVLLIYNSLQKANVRLETIAEKFSDTPIGELVLTWKATYARLEREEAQLRMQRGKRDRIAIGKAPNGHKYPAYGYILLDTERETSAQYEFDHTIIYVDENDVEWSKYKVVCFIFDQLKTESLHALARRLNDMGIPPPHKPQKKEPAWTASAILYIVKNPIYTGEVWANKYKGVTNPKTGKCMVVKRPKEEWIRLPNAPAIITKSEYEAIQKQLAENKDEALRNNKHADELGLLRGGYIFCGICGCRMHVRYQGKKVGNYRYVCNQKAGGKPNIVLNHNTFIGLRSIETAAKEKIIEVLNNPFVVREQVAILRQQNKQPVNEEEVHATIAQLQEEIDNLIDLARYSTNDKNRERLGLLMQDLERQQREAEAMLYDVADDEKEREAIEEGIVWFETWVERVKPFLTDRVYLEKIATYEELRKAIRILGIRVLFSQPLETTRTAITLTPQYRM